MEFVQASIMFALFAAMALSWVAGVAMGELARTIRKKGGDRK